MTNMPDLQGQFTNLAAPEVSVIDQVPIPLEPDGVEAMFVTFSGLSQEHFAVVFPGTDNQDAPLVRVHSSCVTGDIFRSLRCDCGPQLHEALDEFAKTGGIILYLWQEGRGIGLYNKLKTYKLQREGLSTYEANRALGFPDDARTYDEAAAMLKAMGITRVRLLTNNPKKIEGLRAHGIVVEEQISTLTHVTEHNRDYLETKRYATGHKLDV